MKDGTWLNNIVKAMTELGGKARYDDLYQQYYEYVSANCKRN